jgi:hypothetical protein
VHLRFALPVGLAIAGLVALLLGGRACDGHDPDSFGPYNIVAHVEGEAEYIDLVRDGTVALTLAGSLDTLCDPPSVERLAGDCLYVRNCRGHGYVVQRAGGLAYIDEGDGPEPDGWWARQILEGGKRLIALGVLLCLAALPTLAVAGASAAAGSRARASRRPRAGSSAS